MPLVQYVEPGGENYLQFAKRKLQFWHAEMKRSGMRVLARTILVSDGSTIYVNSQMLANGQFDDRIRITVAGSAFMVTDGGALYALSKIAGVLTQITVPTPPFTTDVMPPEFITLDATEDAKRVSSLIVMIISGGAHSRYYVLTMPSAVQHGPYTAGLGLSDGRLSDWICVPATGQFFTPDGTLQSLSGPAVNTQFPVFDFSGFSSRANSALAAEIASLGATAGSPGSRLVVSAGRGGALTSVIVRRDEPAQMPNVPQGLFNVPGPIYQLTYMERYTAAKTVPTGAATGVGFSLLQTISPTATRVPAVTGGDSVATFNAPDGADYSVSVIGNGFVITTSMGGPAVIPYNVFFLGSSPSSAEIYNVPGMSSSLSITASGQTTVLLNDTTSGYPVPYSFWPYTKSIRVGGNLYWFVNAAWIKDTISTPSGSAAFPSGNFTLSYSRWVLNQDGVVTSAVASMAVVQSGFVYSGMTGNTTPKVFCPSAGVTIDGADWFFGVLVSLAFAAAGDGSSIVATTPTFHAAFCQADMSGLVVFGALGGPLAGPFPNDSILYEAFGSSFGNATSDVTQLLSIIAYKGDTYLVYVGAGGIGYAVPISDLSATPVVVTNEFNTEDFPGRLPQVL